MNSKNDPGKNLDARARQFIERTRDVIDWSSAPRSPSLLRQLLPSHRARYRRECDLWLEDQLALAGYPTQEETDLPPNEISIDSSLQASLRSITGVSGVRRCRALLSAGVLEVVLDPWDDQAADDIRQLGLPFEVRFLDELSELD